MTSREPNRSNQQTRRSQSTRAARRATRLAKIRRAPLRLSKLRGTKSSRRGRSNDRVLGVERLEDRQLLATVGNLVWLDLDGNGLQRAGEPGFAGVTVNLLTGTGASIGRSSVTAADGSYQFADLAAGDYIVQFVPPSGRSLTRANVGGDDARDSDADPATGRTSVLTLGAADLRTDVDAGIRSLVAVSIPQDLLAVPGGKVRIPVNIDNAGGIEASDILIKYDTAILDTTNAQVSRGTVWQGAAGSFFVPNVSDAAGSVFVSIVELEPLSQGGGSLVEIEFDVKPNAPAGGTTRIDLSFVDLNEGLITVSPAPIDGVDATDGLVKLEPVVALSLAGSPLEEAAGAATVTARLSTITTQEVIVNLAFSGTATLTDDYTRSGTSITIAAGQLTGSITLTAVQDAIDEVDETIVVDIDTATGAVELPPQQVTATIADDDGPLQVTSLTPNPSGFTAVLSRPLGVVDLNLYDASTGALGPADVTLVGATSGEIRGSVVVAASGRQITFVKTGAPLVTDTYTVTLRSAANGLKDGAGELLDGDADGTPGGDHTNTFAITIDPNEVVVSIPDFARGFGQPVNLPNNSTLGIPVTISTGQNVTSVDFDLVYDPALLTVSGFMTAIANASAVVNNATPGLLRVTVSSASEFSAAAGPIELGRITATVPDAAPYAAKHVLDLTNVNVKNAVLQVRASRADDGIHVAAYVGDGNADGFYSGADTTLLQRLIVGAGSGYTGYQLADPLLIGDINRNSPLSGADTTLLQRLIVGTPITQAPPAPVGITPPAPGGPDPRLFIPTDLTGLPGQTITVPVRLLVTEPAGITISSVDLAIGYDPALFTVSNFRKGKLTTGLSLGTPNTATPGLIQATMSAASGPNLTFSTEGDVFLFDVTINASASSGTTSLNLLQRSPEGLVTAVADNHVEVLTLIPAPSDATSDAVDGTFRIGPAVAESRLAIAATDASKREGNAGTTPFTFRVSREGDTTGETTVDYGVTGSGSHPANAADFGGTLPTGTVTFAIGETSQVVTINVSGDTLVESDEGFTVALSNASGPATIGTAGASGTILNDDVATLTVAILAEAVAENASTTVAITRNTDTTEELVVSLTSTAPGEATVPATATIPVGQSSVTVDLNGVIDNVVDGTQTVTITAQAVGFVDGSATVDVLDIDVDPPQVESVVIGDGTASRSMVSQITVTFDREVMIGDGAFRVVQQGATGGPVTVNVSTSDEGGKTVAVLTFSGSRVRPATRSLMDGNYLLTIDGAEVRNASTEAELDGDEDGRPGGDAVDSFFRLYGDTDGDRDVDTFDWLTFRTVLNQPANYRADLDFDGDGDVDTTDFDAFRLRAGKKI